MTTPDTMLLIDTNVWLDHLQDFRPGHKEAMGLIELAARTETALLYPVTSTKDVFYIVGSAYKSDLRKAKGGQITEADAAIANEFAWACLENMTELGTAVGCDGTDVWLARKQRTVHSDYEDDLVIAAAIRSGALLVTNDEELLRHCPVAAMDVHDATLYLQSLE